MPRVTGEAATRLFRSLLPRLGWCRSCGVPVIGSSRCPRCGSPLTRVRLAPPGDVRPAFEKDVDILWRSVSECVGSRAASKLIPRSSVILLNKVQGIDAADEVIVDGYVVGVRMFDIYARRWIFKPSFVGAMLVVEEKLGYYAVSKVNLKPGLILSKSDLLEHNLPDEPGLFVALVDPRGVYGVGRFTGDSIRVQKTWVLPKGLDLAPKSASLKAVLEANWSRLDELENDAVKFINDVKNLGTVMIALSGGKDSTVAAALAVKAGVKRGYFLDTGLEFPETIKTVEKIVESLGLDVVEASAGKAFWRALGIYGPPGRDYRWCCKVVKFAPLARKLKPLVKDRLVTVTGQRGYESTSRALAGRLAPSATTGRKDLLAAPIQYWTSLEVYLYLLRERLPLNPLYLKGYERIGCFLCPASRLAEIEAIRETHCDLWCSWENYLYTYAKKHGLPKEWVVYGFWRWRFSYPAEMIHLARRLGLNPSRMLEKTLSSHVGYMVEYSREGICYTIVLHDVDVGRVEKLYNLLTVTALKDRAKIVGDKVTVEDSELKITIRLSADGRLEICGEDIHRKPVHKIIALARKILAPAYMVGRCSGCRVCVMACPNNAIKAPHIVDASKCKSCMLCVNSCPSASKLSHHAIRLLERVLESTRQGR